MVAYGFADRFAEPILAGKKAGTVRADRRPPNRHAREDDTVQLYTGWRTPQAKRFATARCWDARPIRLGFRMRSVWIWDGKRWDLLASNGASRFTLDAFAVADGFEGWAGLEEFFRRQYHMPEMEFRGVWIRWDPDTLVASPR